MKLLKLTYLLTTLSLAGTSQAELLWNNGNHDNSGNGVNNQYQRVLDDVYVPGAGWHINGVETHGIFLNPGREVSDVDINIWPADTQTGEPNGDNVESMTGVSFEAVDTGQDWEGYDKIKITVDFDQTFLKGQEYYWVEFDIKDQYGQRINLLERQNVNFQPAQLRSNPYPFPTNVDLAYRLFGSEVKMVFTGGPDKFKLAGLDDGLKAVSFQIVGNGQKIQPGFFQMKMLRKAPVLYRFDEDGKHRYDFKPNPKAPARLSTPLGDDMCQNTSGSLHEYCQSFVACAAYDLFCNGNTFP